MPGPDVALRGRDASRFGRWLGALVLVGLAVRDGFVLIVAGDREVIGDALSYHLWAREIADGNGMVTVSHWQAGAVVTDPEPTAELAPLFPHFLGVVTFLGVTSVAAQKLVMAVVGTLTVAVLGLAGREAAGERVGLLAAGIAAVYPFLWVADGSLMSESLYGLWLSLGLWVAIRFGRRPSTRRAATLGALVALAALTRGEALALSVLVIVPLAWIGGRDLGQRLRLVGAAAAACVVVLAPWTIRNLATFEEPVLIANNSNAVFVGANCEPVYHGPQLGLWNFGCYGEPPPGDESERAQAYRRRGFAYARGNLDRVPVVVAARLGRVWELFRPLEQTRCEVFEGRPRGVSLAGLAVYYPLALAAIAGVARIRRDPRLAIPLVAPLVLVSVVAMAVYGLTRFRFTAEPALVVLAALGLDLLVSRLRNGRVSVSAAEPL